MLFLPLLAAAGIVATPIEAPGPLAPLKGTLIQAERPGPVLLVIPGSGPTDRDGNSPLGVKASPYRLLAEGLAGRGLGTVLIDKRGMFASAPAVANGNDVTIADYAADAHAWMKAIRAETKASCIWLLGHSEGGLVALVAAQDPTDICGIILISAGGRKFGNVIRGQLQAATADPALLGQANAAIDALEQGRPVEMSGMHPGLVALFGPQIQGFMRSLLSYDPAELIARIRKPILILQGDKDIQIGIEDAQRLKGASPKAQMAVLHDTNHVLKLVSGDARANMATYADPHLPLAPAIVPAIVDFVSAHSRAR
jgi:pimeloyl-ACP methyl ester carboxylesterase